MNNQVKYVDMSDVIGELAIDYNIPYLTFESFIELGKRVARIYDLCDHGKKITFHEMCEYINIFIRTPFGKKVLDDIYKTMVWLLLMRVINP